LTRKKIEVIISLSSQIPDWKGEKNDRRKKEKLEKMVLVNNNDYHSSLCSFNHNFFLRKEVNAQHWMLNK